MKSKLASLIIFTSIISVAQICPAIQDKTKYAPSIETRNVIEVDSVVEKNEGADGFTSLQKSTGESKLVSGDDYTP